MLRRVGMLGLLGAITILAAACGGGGHKAPTTSTIGGTVSGLAGAGLALQNNGGDRLTISANGSFTFPTPVAIGAPYAVTIASQPQNPSQTCAVANGSGQSPASGTVTTVTVNCTTNTYLLGGEITGLAGSGLVLQNTGGDSLTVPAGATDYRFPARVPSGARYEVRIAAQPSSPTQTCQVANASNVMGAADVLNVALSCTTNTYRISGTVSGLGNASVTLSLVVNPGIQGGTAFNETITVSGTTAFNFASAVPSGYHYGITILTQPAAGAALVCFMTGGDAGMVGGANVTDVVVTCRPRQYTLGGTVSGLRGTGLVLQNDEDASNTVTVDANGAFVLPGPLASGESYRLSVLTQPSAPGQHCTMTNVAGTVAQADIRDITVRCKDVARFAYALSVDSGAGTFVVPHTIDPVTGVLTALPGAPRLPGSLLDATSTLVTSPDFRFLFVGFTTRTGVGLNFDGLAAYAIDASTGALRELPGSPYTLAARPTGLTVDPSGRFVFISHQNDGAIEAFAIDPATGALTTASGVSPGGAVKGGPLQVHPNGRWLYMSSAGTGFDPQIWGYAIDPTSGALTPMPGTPFREGLGGSSAPSLAIVQGGQEAYPAPFGSEVLLLTRRHCSELKRHSGCACA